MWKILKFIFIYSIYWLQNICFFFASFENLHWNQKYATAIFVNWHECLLTNKYAKTAVFSFYWKTFSFVQFLLPFFSLFLCFLHSECWTHKIYNSLNHFISIFHLPHSKRIESNFIRFDNTSMDVLRILWSYMYVPRFPFGK